MPSVDVAPKGKVLYLGTMAGFAFPNGLVQNGWNDIGPVVWCMEDRHFTLLEARRCCAPSRFPSLVLSDSHKVNDPFANLHSLTEQYSKLLLEANSQFLHQRVHSIVVIPGIATHYTNRTKIATRVSELQGF